MSDTGERCDSGSWHVSPEGRSDGDGTALRPWDLATALKHPPAVKPGDTIWLHGGVYHGAFVSEINGTSDRPIIVRQAAGERATIDGGDSGGKYILLVNGQYTWYWGFEVMSPDPHRWTTIELSHPGDLPRGGGIDLGDDPGTAIGTKFINLIVHDTRQGFGFWKYGEGSEIYGCLIYHNGWDAPDRGHGHSIYAQNEVGERRIVDNISFNEFSHGIHVYGSQRAFLNNFHIEGNICFNNGAPSKVSGYTRGILVGGGRVAANPVVTQNYCYFAPSRHGGRAADLAFANGCHKAVVEDNYFAALSGTAFCIKSSGAKVDGNTFVGPVEGIDAKDRANNVVYDSANPPTGIHVFVRPNQYESGRAHIAVFDWDNRDSVTCDLSAVLRPGDEYEIRDAQNYFGPAVARGTYDAGAVMLPMNLATVSEIVGGPHSDITHTPKEFGAFVVIRKKAGRA